MSCKICQYIPLEEFSEKAQKHDRDLERRKKISYQTQLSMHILSVHSLTIKEYVILTEYLDIAPKCACGFCNELPVFSRGKFSIYALDHDTFEFRENAYVEKFGIPQCLHCGKTVLFKRGEPNKFCSIKCAGTYSGGFTQPETQKLIRKNNLKKYGVEIISQVPEFAKKISISKKGKYTPPKDPEQAHQRKSEAAKKNWTKLEYRERVGAAISEAILSNPKEIERRKEYAKIAMQDPARLNSMISNLPTRLTGLHRKIRKILGLDLLGFTSEQRISRYLVDELNEEKKIIVEINGDYPHANPKKFNEDYIVRLRGQQYTAGQKWEYDELRKNNLKKLGYTVFVIWQSDSLVEKRKELYQLLNIPI